MGGEEGRRGGGRDRCEPRAISQAKDSTYGGKSGSLPVSFRIASLVELKSL